MRRPACVFAVALVAGAAAPGCSRPPAPEATIGRAGSPPSMPSTTAAIALPAVTFTVASFDVEGAADPASVERVKAAVVATLSRYLETAVLTPVLSGGPAGDLAPLFTARAAEHMAATADRNAFVDEGLPPAPRVVPLVSGLHLAGLADQKGEVVLVSAHMDLKLAADAGGTTIVIDRGGDLLLVPDGDAWKIDSYRVRVTRDTPGSPSAAAARVR